MLFGHQNDDAAAADANSISTPSADGGAPPVATQNPLAVDPDTGASLPTVPEPLEHEHTDYQNHESSVPAAPPDFSSQAPAPDNNNDAQTEQSAPVVEEHKDSTRDDLLQASDTDGLLHLKQAALEQLSPLVGHLDQTPEEKFRTTMMMIQSSDNQALIQTAYDAAQAITDDKTRAQALLDIVNEINYFTHAGQDSQDQDK